MLKLVRDKYEISASFVRDKCVTNGVGYYPEATTSLSWHSFCPFAHELKIVDSFEDIKVKIVDSFEDIKVKIVQNFEGVKR